MFIDTPQRTLIIAAKDDGITDDGTHYVLRMRRDSSLFMFENRDAIPSEAAYAAVAKQLTWQTDVSISPDQAKAILSLYPQARIKVAMYGIGDTDVREALSFAIAHFFLGCSWPTYGDEVDLESFIATMRKQASLMGFDCVDKSVHSSDNSAG